MAYIDTLNAVKSSSKQVGDYRMGSSYMAFLNQKAREEQEARNKKVMDEWQGAYDEAKSANETRYNDILGQYGQRYDTAVSDLQGMGDAEKAALENAYRISGSQQQQALVNSGLASTTIRPAAIAQNTKMKEASLSQVNERLQNQALTTKANLSGDKLQFMERREDPYPDQTYYLELLKQAGYAA